MTTALRVKKNIKEQGRKKIWVAKQLGISRQYLDRKLEDNYWSAGDIIRLKSIGLL